MKAAAVKTSKPALECFYRGITAIACALAIILSVTVFAGNASAMPWSWDLFNQPNHRAQKEPAPPQPEGTVTTAGKPYYAKDRDAAAKLRNPFPADSTSVERGKARYTIFCATCHGDGGKGDGLVGQKYVAPTDLTSDYVQTKPDGDIFFTITNGGLAIMPSYADSVPADDRWHIVNYIKNSFKGK